MKVWVTWDPLLEEVVCVHSKEDTVCPKCNAICIRAEADGAYYPEEKEFEVVK